ncbi:hypothetical protein LOD99_6340 [Oopsacas minuta]|uniref:THAP-type domain-containing protein n=1 Tax=Oopsacas minuta TaxID=111878 RepID=A0AAV7JNK1_9METZ|nr:hypothetical protein LOD99_6340 [Oopsacas minuta]
MRLRRVLLNSFFISKSDLTTLFRCITKPDVKFQPAFADPNLISLSLREIRVLDPSSRSIILVLIALVSLINGHLSLADECLLELQQISFDTFCTIPLHKTLPSLKDCFKIPSISASDVHLSNLATLSTDTNILFNSCTSHYDPKGRITVYTMPQMPDELRHVWPLALHRDHIDELKVVYVCSKHFKRMKSKPHKDCRMETELTKRCPAAISLENKDDELLNIAVLLSLG